MEKKERMLSIYVDPKLHMEIKIKASEEKRSMKQLVNEILNDYIKDVNDDK